MGTIAGAGRVASVLASVYGGDDSLINNIRSKEGRELLLTNGNIITLIDSLIIEPRIIIPKNLSKNPNIGKLIEKQMSFFSGIYTLGFKHMVSTLGVDVSTAMSLLSTNKRVTKGLISDLTANSFIDGDTFNFDDITVETHKKEDTVPYIRTLTIDLESMVDGEKKIVKINVIVKANIQYVNPGSIERLMIDNDSNQDGFFARLDDVRSGAISWGEFWFPIDMIKRDKEKRLADKDDLLKDMREMSEEAHMKMLKDGAIGFGKNYRFFIIDEKTRATIELNMGKTFRKGGASIMLDDTNSLGITILDETFEVVTTYINGTSGSLEHSFRELSSGKDSKTDDILAYLAGMK